MAIDRIESGFATLQYEIVEERASALGRMGRRLEATSLRFLAVIAQTQKLALACSRKQDIPFGS